MFSAFSLARSRHRLGLSLCTSIQTSPVNLPAGFPSPDDDVPVFGEVHTAHRTGVNVPSVQQASFKTAAFRLRCQQIDVAVRRICCGSVEQIDIILPVRKNLHPATAACSG